MALSQANLRAAMNGGHPPLSNEVMESGKALGLALQASTARIFTPEIRKRMALAQLLPKPRPIIWFWWLMI